MYECGQGVATREPEIWLTRRRVRTNCQFSGGGCQSGAPSGRRGSTSGVEQHLKGVQAFILSPCSSEPLASTIPPSLSWGIFQTTINTLSSVAWPWGVEEEEGGGGGGGGGGGRWRTAEEIGQEEINEVREDVMVGRKSWLTGSYRKIVCWVVKGMRRWRWWEKCLKDHDRVCEVAQTKYYVSLLLRCAAVRCFDRAWPHFIWQVDTKKRSDGRKSMTPDPKHIFYPVTRGDSVIHPALRRRSIYCCACV